MARQKYNTKGRPPGTSEERFWKKVERGGAEECWNWVGSTSTSGYGVFQKGKRGKGLVRAHRFSYQIHYGPIDDGCLILHSCDNKTCCNPSHLSIGDYSKNLKEAWSRGRRKLSDWNISGFAHNKTRHVSRIRSRIRFTV
jgi:hypothetical protein